MRKNYFPILCTVLVLSITSSIYAQSPGGVKAPELWFKTVPVIPNKPQGQYKWQDFSGDSATLNIYSNKGAAFGAEHVAGRVNTCYYNFNPGWHPGRGDFGDKNVLIKGSNLSQCTIFGLYGLEGGNFNQEMLAYTLNGRAGDGVIFTKDKVVQSKESAKTALDYGSTDGIDLMYGSNAPESKESKFRERGLRVAVYYRANVPNHSVWGEHNKSVLSLSDLFNSASVNNTSTFPVSQFDNTRKLWAFQPELIIYSRFLTPLERRKVETYLAIKYGFSLETSYITSSDRMIWDRAANDSYSNRITATTRDDASGLSQPLSTTSYEEQPNFTEFPTYESYDDGDCNNRSNRYHLLVMGRPYGTNMNDGDYTIWGDDDKSFKVEGHVIGGMKTISRNWKLYTNVALPEQYNNSESVELWKYNGVQMTANANLRSFIKEFADSSATGTAVTKMPLSGSNGYLKWTVDAPVAAGAVTVKFGTQTPAITAGTNDYGYYINTSGQVFSVIAGVKKAGYIATVVKGTKVEIEKSLDKISLRINGSILLNQDITINPADTAATYYATVLMEKGTKDMKLTDFMANGFYYGNYNYKNNGENRIEVSYMANRASDFATYRNGQCYLIVDRSGTGTYPKESTEYYATNELDESRSKIIFNNIFWDTDKSGSDVFTFGYLEAGKVSISVDSLNPTCTNGLPNKDGIVKVGIQSGLKGLTYSLVNTQDTSKKYTGRLFDDTLSITGLPVGSYALAVTEIGGNDFQTTGSGSYRPSAVSSGYLAGNCSVDFLAGGKSTDDRATFRDHDAAVGFKVSSTTVTLPVIGYAVPDYGIYKSGGSLYAIIKGAQEVSSFATVQTGDKITIEKNVANIIYKVNGVEVARRSIPVADQTLRYFAEVLLSNNSAGELGNLNVTGFSTGSWQTTDNMVVKQSVLAKATATATIKNACVLLPAPASLRTVAADPHLNVYYKSNSLMTFNVKVTLDNPGNSQILVFNLSGQLVYKTQLNNNTKEQQTDITLQTPGFYVVKAITPEGEFSKQVVVQ